MRHVVVNEAWGFIRTDNGGEFELEGSYFVRTLPVLGGPSFPVHDLPMHLSGLRVVSIGGEDIGDEAHTLINGREYGSPEAVNRLFNLN